MFILAVVVNENKTKEKHVLIYIFSANCHFAKFDCTCQTRCVTDVALTL